jgi:hypothetical protein
MYRILSALVLLLGIVWLAQQPGARAQIGQLGCGAVNQHSLVFQPCGVSGSSPFTPSCTPTTDFLARTSGLTDPQKTNYDNLICGLETDSVGCVTGGAMYAVYVLAAPDSATSLLNLCGTSFSLVSHGTITFTANVGYVGNGSDGYLDTQFNPNSAGVTVSSFAIGGYITSARTMSASMFLLGTTDSGVFDYIRPLNSSAADFGVNDGSFTSAANTQAKGQWIGSRTTATQVDLYLNSSLTPFATNAASADAGPPATNIAISALWNGSAASNFSTDQISFVFLSTGLSAANAKKVADRINTFATALGINAY